MHGVAEMETIAGYFFKNDNEKAALLKTQWDDFKFLEVTKKWLQFKNNIERNKLKLQTSATGWLLKNLMMSLQGGD